jgi:hypothetical protein
LELPLTTIHLKTTGNKNYSCGNWIMLFGNMSILSNGTIEEKRDLVKALDRQLYIKDRFISSSNNSNI